MAVSKAFILSLSLASTLLASAPAMAEFKSKKVRYADLNLASETGRDRLEMRIKQAVKKVCASPPAFTLAERMDQTKCETAAYRKAAPESARIIAAYMEKNRLALADSAAAVTN
jgi:UrcA family protein